MMLSENFTSKIQITCNLPKLFDMFFNLVKKILALAIGTYAKRMYIRALDKRENI